jgi:hypothetical protein
LKAQLIFSVFKFVLIVESKEVASPL